MGQYGVMTDLVEPGAVELEARGEHTAAMTLLYEGLHLVDREDLAHAIGQFAGDMGRVVAEGLGGVARLPTAALLQGLRQVPVIERREGFDTRGKQLVDQAVVEVEALGIGLASAVGKHARPGDREAIGLRPHPLHQRDVFLVAVIVIDAGLAARAVANAAGLPSERVPDRRTAAVDLGGALDLVGRRRRSPAKAIRETRCGSASGRRCPDRRVRRSIRRCCKGGGADARHPGSASQAEWH